MVMDCSFLEEEEDDQALSSQSDPYGHYWDVLWLGHCGSLGPHNGRVYPFNDSTSPPMRFEYLTMALDPPDPAKRPDNLRAVYAYEERWTLCTYAYAVSLEGARKLRQAGEESFSMPWDLRLNHLCREIPAFRCAVVSPAIITAAFSASAIRYPDQTRLPPPLANPGNDRVGPNPGPGIQISARRNSKLAPGASRASWVPEWP